MADKPAFAHVRNLANGMFVLGQRDGTLFVRLPVELQTPIDGCRCPYCTAHPDQPPMWDTLAISTAKPKPTCHHTWTVHMPDGCDAR